MSNLGKYQDIVSAAKAAGGVENLISKIETGAVDKAAPGLLGKGALMGAGALLAAVLGKQYWDKRKVRIANANDAKDQLRATVEESEVSESAIAGDDKTPSGADAEA